MRYLRYKELRVKNREFAGLISLVALLVSALYSVRVGAITLAVALAIYSLPGLRSRRAVERVIPIALIVSLITVALALPRR